MAASTLEWVRSPIADVRSTGVALAVAMFFGIAYVTTWALDGLQHRSDNSSPLRSDRVSGRASRS